MNFQNSDAVLPALNEEMQCGIFTNSAGKILIVHDNTLFSPVEWIEFDKGEKTLTIILEDGKMQPVTVDISEKMAANLCNGQDVILAQISQRNIVSMQEAVILIKDY